MLKDSSKEKLVVTAKLPAVLDFSFLPDTVTTARAGEGTFQFDSSLETTGLLVVTDAGLESRRLAWPS